MSPFNIGFNNPPAARAAARDTVMLRGGNRRPNPPTSIIVQPASQKVMVSWQIPSDSRNLGCSTRVYLDTERYLIQTIAPGQTSTQVALSGGSNPPVRGLFFSLITPAGIESRKVFVTGHALADSSTASDPPPSGGGTGGSGGGGGGRFCFSGNTLVVAKGGNRAIDTLRMGDDVLTAAGIYLPIERVHVHEYRGWLQDMGPAGLVTAEHPILDNKSWKSASAVFSGRERFEGKIYNLTVKSDEPLEESQSSETQRSYVLSLTGLKVHNLKMVNP